jgi:hypothetical protein
VVASAFVDSSVGGVGETYRADGCRGDNEKTARDVVWIGEKEKARGTTAKNVNRLATCISRIAMALMTLVEMLSSLQVR